MYCIKCGVRLADTEKACPLCGTRCCHPDIPMPESPPLYPHHTHPQPQFNPLGVMSALTVLTLIPLAICLLCDLQPDRTITWSGYAIGSILLFYELFLLPGWFQKPNPVVFVPCGFAAICLYLLYICLQAHGTWFLSFAFPLVGGIGLICTALTALLKYVHGGKLYIFGGSAMALGLMMPILELLAIRTFHSTFSGWSILTLTALVLLGGYLIFLAICSPARESMSRKFFI